MRRRFPLLVLILVLSVGLAPIHAASRPAIDGDVSGVELCQQATCGAAIFIGLYVGRVGLNPYAVGIMTVAVTHDDLPATGEIAAITGGVWRLRLLSGRTFTGVVTGGALANPRGDDTFDVRTELLVTDGGVGTLGFDGVLSHTTFPPTIGGALHP
jgi:hypothetical protein